MSGKVDVSVIIPVHNAESWLNECIESVFMQDFLGKIEVSVYDDASSDKSRDILESWKEKLEERGTSLIISGILGEPKGVGYAKNKAVRQSSGEYLCFLDADDVMHCCRVRKQYEICRNNENVIVGSRFHRSPLDSTPRYTAWANSLSQEQLYLQIYTAFGPTVVMPTWFCHRQVFDSVGGFNEKGKGTPEDLIFFYCHLRLGGQLIRADEDLLMYRYHPSATTFSISEDTIWEVRLHELEQKVIKNWTSFTIWNAGKQGRKLYRSLCAENKLKVKAFCDVDVKKLSKGKYIYEESEKIPKPQVPIVHFKDARSPFVLCVKIAMTSGSFEENLSSLNIVEGKDYVHFS